VQRGKSGFNHSTVVAHPSTVLSLPAVSCQRPAARIVPPRPQVDEPRCAVVQLAGEPERRHTAALELAPRVVAGRRLRDTGGVERLAHAAQRVGAVPRAGAMRAVGSVPRNTLPNITTISARTPAGMGPNLMIEGGMTHIVFEAAVEHLLGPTVCLVRFRCWITSAPIHVNACTSWWPTGAAACSIYPPIRQLRSPSARSRPNNDG
jgi:hypothetical protein